ncbi:MAG: adenylate/guanylate cyclase domain-containing protein [Oligoflexia bacterium]|nr:adenylate/guanylate cyclase domain-containing protein [Oligoflexia bacterium]
MKNKLWLLQLPLVVLFAAAFLIMDMGVRGELRVEFLRDRVFGTLRNVSTALTDVKFKLRGPVPPKNKIVILEIDEASLEAFGRWPWHRDVIASMVDESFKAGAKAVGMDVVFAEMDKRVPDQLFQYFANQNMMDFALKFETDLDLSRTVERHRERLVLGWAASAKCQPLYFNAEECPITNEEALALQPAEMAKFSIPGIQFPSSPKPHVSPLLTVVSFVANLPIYNQPALHAGYFDSDPDPDGYVRRIPLMMLANLRAYPSLALEMARVGLGEELVGELDENLKLRKLAFAKSGRSLEVNGLAVAEINFRGPRGAFPYVSVADLLDVPMDGASEEALTEREQATRRARELIKDAYVLVGPTALGIYDMRAFPFDTNVPGVEGHATILDNILSGDFLRRGTGPSSWIWIFLFMTIGAMSFGYATQRLEAVPALALFVGLFAVIGLIDLKLFFERQNINWDTSFLLFELFSIFVVTVAAKYVIEERSKKFVRGAFAKYVAPAVVDSILKDPAKLSVGGVKKDLTIMFSDIRSFTTFSERMDAKALAAFLNEYLGTMTEIVFAHEGTLDKYIGDAIMAFWGAPLDQKNHAENACQTAIKMMAALHANKDRFKTQYGIDVNIGVGINSGAVSVGNMGSNNNFAYTVIGDHVNLASRLEGLTKAYGVTILTTRFTFDEIDKAGGARPPHRVLDHVKVKGKKKAVELIQVLDREYRPEGLKLFEEARSLYSQQKWDEASALFVRANELLRVAPGNDDGPSVEYQERCRTFKAQPPASDWDGSWEMHTK